MKSLKLGRDNWARTRPTKEGITFLGLTFFVGFAALNTGNNLLYLIFGMMLSFIATSGIMSMINLSGIEIKINPLEDVFALTPTPLRFSVRNLKILIPSYSLTIDIEGRRAFMSYLPPKVTKTLTVWGLFKKRGWNKFPQAILFTKFPFGFFKKWIRIDFGNEQEVLVYPKVEKLAIDKDAFQQEFGEKESESLGFGGDLRSIRAYHEGDNPKFIHWRTTAKIGELMLRELQDDESKRITIEFNPKSRTEVEREITYIASLLLALIERNYEVEFISPDGTFSPVQIGRFPRPVLRYLALFKYG
ncbi:MAG: hypothetical protein C4291_06505 [Candidatus Dadabacteria bacterium]